MQNSFNRNDRGLYCLLVSFVLLIVFVVSCEKAERISFSGTGAPALSPNQSRSSITVSSAMSRQDALNRINALFKDELYPVSAAQVQGINKQQFTQWLRNSNIAGAEQKYLTPLLSSNVSEFILLNNVTLRQTGKKVTIAMLAVPSELYARYTKVIVLTASNLPPIGKICMWFQCDYLDPNMCLCLAKIGSVPLASPTPVSECGPDLPCREQSGQPCDDPFIDQVISYW